MKRKSKSCWECRYHGPCPFPYQAFFLLCRLIGYKALRKISLNDVYDDVARFVAKRCPSFEEVEP